jgi:hypothetical protein
MNGVNSRKIFEIASALCKKTNFEYTAGTAIGMYVRAQQMTQLNNPIV